MARDTNAFRQVNIANERENLDKRRFNPLVCQCCNYTKATADDPECVCDGLDWYMDKAGNVECQAHRFARAIGATPTTFLMGQP
jgi:hypothetical protein